jgi:ribosome-associated protein
VLQVDDTLAIPESELDWTYVRSGGPGGQNVNKVASKAVLRWNLVASPSVPADVKLRLRAAYPAHVTTEGEFLVTSQKYRDQGRNRDECREKLVRMLRRALVVQAPRVKTRPSKSSKLRRLANKKRQAKRRSERKVEHE